MVPLINEAAHPVGTQQIYDKNIGFKVISILRIVLEISVLLVPGNPWILTFIETEKSSMSLII